MTEVNRKLVADLARLASRYPPKDWQRLLAALDDQRLREQVTSLLRELGAASSDRREKTPSQPRQPSLAAQMKKRLDEIRTTDPVRAELLDDVWLRLRQRDLLPTMTAVRAFAEATGVKDLASRREKAVTELMHHLVDLPNEILQRMTQLGATDNRQPGEEYERWVALILGSEHPRTG